MPLIEQKFSLSKIFELHVLKGAIASDFAQRHNKAQNKTKRACTTSIFRLVREIFHEKEKRKINPIILNRRMLNMSSLVQP